MSHSELAAMVASGRASLSDMAALGADRVAQIKTHPEVLQVRAKAQEALAVNEESRTISYLVSDETVDRMGDIIKVKGWDIASYKKNPVVLWAHDGKSVPPIGKSTNVRRRYGPPRLTADIEFAPKEAFEFADTIYQLAARGFVRATSVGFMPTEAEEVDEKKREKLGLGPYGQLYTGAELMEISVVAVPANPSALQDGVKALTAEGLLDDGKVARFFDIYPASEVIALTKVRAACRSFVDFGAAAAKQAAESADDAAHNADDPVEKAIPEALAPTIEERQAKPPHDTAKAPVGQAWDAAAMWHEIAENYEGEAKAKRYWDVVAYRVNDADPESQSSYKFPHHDANGEVVWRGVVAAMAALNGARGGPKGLSEADKKGIHAHLAAHYKQFEEEAPPLRAVDDAEEKSPACRMDGESEDECVERKVPELIGEGMEDDQAVAAAHSMCETACDDEYKSDLRLVEAVASLIEQQAEQTRATRQLVDALSDLTARIHGEPRGGTDGDSVHESDARVPDADERSSEEVDRLVNRAIRGFADRIGRDILTKTPNPHGIKTWTTKL